MLAVSSGDTSMPIQCYKVSVVKSDDKCIMTSQSLPSFFLLDEGKDRKFSRNIRDIILISLILVEHFNFKNKRSYVTHIKWIVREDADSLVVAAYNDNGSCLQVWELREKAIPVHELLSGPEQKYLTTVVR